MAHAQEARRVQYLGRNVTYGESCVVPSAPDEEGDEEVCLELVRHVVDVAQLG